MLLCFWIRNFAPVNQICLSWVVGVTRTLYVKLAASKSIVKMISEGLLIKVRNFSKQIQKEPIKHIIKPCDLTPKDVKAMFNLARRLKGGTKVPELKNKIITLLLNEDDLKAQAALFKIAQHLDMGLNVIFDRDMTRDSKFVEDVGRLLSEMSDIVLCKLIRHPRTSRLAKHSTVPIVNLQNRRYALYQVLTGLFTFQEHFGSIKGLNMAWIGPPGPFVNTYLPLAAMSGLNLRFYCLCKTGTELMSPECLQVVKEICVAVHSTIEESRSLVDALRGAHVIVTQMHNIPQMKISQTSVKVADDKWVLLHTLPRGSDEVDETIFDGPRNITFKSFGNASWVCGALLCKRLGITSAD